MEAIERENPNKLIKDYVERDGPKDWQHAETLKFLYHALEKMEYAFLSPRDESQLAIPQAVLGISKEDIRILAFFRTTYNPNGLPLEIILNEVHIARSRWELCESLAHEALHLYQEYMVKKKQHDYFSCTGNNHNRQFCSMAKEIGLNVFPGAGFHFAPPDKNSQFEKLLHLIGEERPEEAKPGDGKLPPIKPSGNWWDVGPKPKGSSLMLLYTCDSCDRQPRCKIRSGRSDLEIGCRRCGGDFHPA